MLYFTQLMGLAYGIGEKTLGFGTEIVSAKALARAGRIPEANSRFTELYDRSEAAANLTFEAAEVFHLTGNFDEARRYRDAFRALRGG